MDNGLSGPHIELKIANRPKASAPYNLAMIGSKKIFNTCIEIAEDELLRTSIPKRLIESVLIVVKFIWY